MSHTVTIQLEMKDEQAICQALQRIDGATFVKPSEQLRSGARDPASTIEEARGKHRIYSGTYEGVGVMLPGWQYPAVINTVDGVVKYDNYNGRWGVQDKLDEFSQLYAVEKSRNEAAMRGMQAIEETLDDGSIKLTINDYAV